MITLNKEDAFTIVDIISKAQEIIRCKDCKYNGRDEDVEWSPEDIACEYWAIDGLEADDFCSRGEKR